MAGNLPVPQGFQIRLFWGTGTTDEAINVLHCRNSAGGVASVALANTISALVKSTLTSSGFGAQLVPTVFYRTTRIRDMSDNANAEFVSTDGGQAGTAGVATPLPANVSMCLTGLTGKRGASFRSRTYLWGYSVSSVATTGGIDPAASTASAAFMNGLRTGLAGLSPTLILSVLSRFTTPPGTSTAVERNPPILTDITSYIVKDNRWDSQRRRAVPGI